jgi:hypothetical protein
MGKANSQEQKRASGEGERAARRGYMHQDRSSARLIYEALISKSLVWVGLADRAAGVVDDFVLGTRDSVIAHQFKKSINPAAVGLKSLLLGKQATVAQLASAFKILRRQFPMHDLQLRYLSNDHASRNDRLVIGKTGFTTTAFLEEWASYPSRNLADWLATDWKPVFEELLAASGLDEVEFEDFWKSFSLVLGPEVDGLLSPSGEQGREDQTEVLARAIGSLVADNPGKDRWTRAELLDAVGWRDSFAMRFTHSFPIGSYVQLNEETEANLSKAIAQHQKGYLSLLGPPGVGKSTLLQRELRSHAKLNIIRYLAFIPGDAQGQGRGEANSFYDDVNAQLIESGLTPLRVKDDSLAARQQAFEHLLKEASHRYEATGQRYIVVVDGLDHIPREETPDHSLLRVLPLPQSVPDGVLFILGSQRLDFADMPPSVQAEADTESRRIVVSPLPKHTIAAMADAFGLAHEVSRDEVYRIGSGHPLATRYLLEQLIAADEEARASLLTETQPFGGDLEAVYEAAWRSIEQVQGANSVKKVLALLGFAEGRIVPEALAAATSDEAVETALRHVRHLLDINSRGWRVFHNSFRLFIQRKPVLRFGNPDADFSAPAIYQKLADLVDTAPRDNDQKWLKFRYLFLAGNYDAALSLADREYFVDQYCGGRRAYLVRREISDGLKALVERNDPVKLFDLMLADDEIGRRSSIMELTTSIIDAHLAIGDLDAAYDALQERYEDGKQWLVVDALLEAGKVELAREIFENENPFAFRSSRAPPYRGTYAWEAFPWAQRAVVFLDDEQIDRRISSGFAAIALKDEYGNESLDNSGAEEAAAAIKFQVARAVVESDPTLDLTDVQARWGVSSDRLPVLQLEAAIAASENGDVGKSDKLLREALAHKNVDKLHSSWFLSASRAACKNQSLDLAQAYVKLVPIPSLAEIERSIQSQKLSGVAKLLVDVIELRVLLGLETPQFESPTERLLRGVQHHLVALASAIGRIRSGEEITQTEASQLAIRAVNFLATSGLPDSSYSTSGYEMPRMAETILMSIFRMLKLCNINAHHVLETVDKHLEQGKPVFRWWHSFRRSFAILGYQLDGDTEKAMARLRAGLTDLGTTYNPEEEIEEKAAYAAAIARVGCTDQAREILSTLRRDAYGTYLAAKKDGQYELWASALSNANKQDPEQREHRAPGILRLADGLTHTEGNDSAWRMGRQILYEATSATPDFACKAARWALNSDILSWDGIVDAVLRGVLERDSSKALAALLAWAHLSLPWYDEPHGSTTATGQFLKDLMAKADSNEIAKLEVEAATAIVRLAKPNMKFDLLKILEESARLRGFGEASSAASIEFGTPMENLVDEDPERKSYRHIIDLDGLANAATTEAEYFKNKNKAEQSSYRRVTYGLRRAAVRVIGHSQWSEIASFMEAHPDLAVDNDVKEAAAKAALAAGQPESARALFADVLNSEGEGWGWASGRERQRLHEVRHVLGEPGAHDRARRDFISDMANARYGVGTALMEADAIFPLLFEQVPWSGIWDRLESQFKTTREFRMGKGVSAEIGCANDSDLLAALFVEALTLGVPVVNVEAAHGALHLLEYGQNEVFTSIVERLLGSDGECRLMAMELMTESATFNAVADKFRPYLPSLAADPDAGVAATASFLAEQWDEPIQYERRPLAGFYELELPDHDSEYGNPAADVHTKGLIIDDTFGWTDPWKGLVNRIARYGSVTTAHIRWRVGQLIQTWGGVAKFGHEGSKQLEDKLKRLSMGMAYRRPQSEVALRALRHVVQELFLSGRISADDWRLLLHKLRVDPSRVMLRPSSARPMKTSLPVVPRVIFGKERTDWAGNVKDDLALTSSVASGKILAEWSQKTVRDIRVNITMERLTRISEDSDNQTTLDQFLDELPEVFGSGGLTPLYRQHEISASRTACLNPHRLQSVPIAFLMFCPLTAAQLRWRHDPSHVGMYRDLQGNEMARTIWWRDGLPQPVEQDQSWAEGQQVVLTDDGVSEFEERFGPIKLTTSVWRRVEADKDDGESVEFYATNAPSVESTM